MTFLFRAAQHEFHRKMSHRPGPPTSDLGLPRLVMLGKRTNFQPRR